MLKSQSSMTQNQNAAERYSKPIVAQRQRLASVAVGHDELLDLQQRELSMLDKTVTEMGL